MICSKCGAEGPSAGNFCANCGASLRPQGGITYSDLYFSFSGRITRSTYWLKFWLPFNALYVALLLVDISAGTLGDGIAMGFFSGIFAILSLYPNFAVLTKRFHDRNRSGLWALLAFVPLINIWALIEIGFLRGTQGPNRFGPDPLMAGNVGPFEGSGADQTPLPELGRIRGTCATCRFFKRMGIYDARKGICDRLNKGMWDNRSCDSYEAVGASPGASDLKDGE